MVLLRKNAALHRICPPRTAHPTDKSRDSHTVCLSDYPNIPTTLRLRCGANGM